LYGFLVFTKLQFSFIAYKDFIAAVPKATWTFLKVACNTPQNAWSYPGRLSFLYVSLTLFLAKFLESIIQWITLQVESKMIVSYEH
jgi:hypothetical protein